jgi:hypothetical protein
MIGIAVTVTLTFIGVVLISGGDANDGEVSIEPPVYEGPPVDLPPPADERKRVILSDPGRRDELSKVQAPLVAAGDRLQQLADEHRFPGFTGLAIEDGARAVVLYWKGEVPHLVEALIDELSPDVNVEVRAVDYSRDELLAESRRIAGLGRTPSGASIVGVGPLSDYSGLEVVLDSEAAAARGPEEIKSWIHLEFTSGSPATAISG